MAALVEILPLALLGGVLGLDVVSFPQAMISRPLVAATIAGALIGQPAAGLVAGATLEMAALETLPFGASRYPEWGSAATVGGALFASHVGHPAAALVVAVIGALATAWVGGWTMVKLRRRNADWARDRRDALEAGARGSVIGLQLLGLSADLLRGMVLTAVAYAVLAPVAETAIAHWGVETRFSRALVAGALASVGGAAMWKLYHGLPGARWLFLGGLALGLLLMRAQ